MLNIFFSDSAAGGFRYALGYGKGAALGGCVSVIFSSDDGTQPTAEERAAAQKRAEEDECRKWEQALPLGGDPADVAAITLAWSMGDITDAAPESSARTAVLQSLYDSYPQQGEPDWMANWQAQSAAATAAVLRRAAAGEELRLWVDATPEAACGMVWLMDLLEQRGSAAPVSVVVLPHWHSRADGTSVGHAAWGEVEPCDYGRLALQAQPFPPDLQAAAALKWRLLQAENTPLRGMINGCLTSLPADFYDRFIRREIAVAAAEAGDGIFEQARVIGNVLGKYRLGVGDSFLALRMEEMVKAGELIPLTNPPADAPRYHRKMRRA